MFKKCSFSAPIACSGWPFAAFTRIQAGENLWIMRALQCKRMVKKNGDTWKLSTRWWGWSVCVCQCWALLMPFCSLTRTENPSGPTWSGRTPALPPALRPPPPCARRPPPPARCRPPGRTCAPAAVWRSWTDTCWRWEAGHTFRLFVFLFTLTDRNSSSAQGNRELMK